MPDRRGFTFIELMLVVTIIAILAAIAVPNFLEAKTRASVARSRAEMTVLKMAIEAYWLDSRSYPLNREPGVAHEDDLLCLTTPVPYITRLPDDFLTTPEARPRQRDAVPARASRYQFVNGLQLDPERGLRQETPELSMGQGYIGALLWGTGPARIPDDAPLPRQWGAPFTTIHPDGSAFLIPYDPSNGTFSRGDIHTRIP